MTITVTRSGEGRTFSIGENTAEAARLAAAAESEADRAEAAATDVADTVESLVEQQVIGRPATPVDGAGFAEGTYVFATPVALDGTLRKVRVWGRTTSTLKIRRFSKSGDTFTQVGADTNISIVVGLNEVDVSIAVLAGEFVGFYSPLGVVSYLNDTSDSGGYYNSSADSTSFTDASVNTSLQLQIGFDIASPYVTKSRVQGLESDVTAAQATVLATSTGLEEITSRASLVIEDYAATTQFGTTLAGWAGAVLLEGVAVGTALKRIGFDRVYVGPSATKVRLQIYSRPDGTTAAPPTACTLVFEKDYTLAELGLTAGSGTRETVLFEFPVDFIKSESAHLAWRWEALDGADARQPGSIGFLPDASATASERGWFYQTTGSSSYNAVSAPNRVSVRVARDRFVLASAPSGGIFEAASAEIAVDGSDVVVTGTLYAPGGDGASISGTLTPALASAGKERMDKIVVDRSTGALSLVAGDERDEQLDSLEWQADTPANSLVLGRARVTDAQIDVISSAAFRGVVKRGTEAEVSWMVDRNRRLLRGVLGKAMRGDPINLGGYGDSITAFQANSPSYVANGTFRDRAADAYLANYPADSKALLTLYDTGDGAGQVHTRLGWNWEIKSALDELAGAQVVQYLNYGIGSTTSENSEPVAGRGNGLWPARIAVPLGDSLDAVVIAFGMNERGQSYTYSNIVNMIEQFQAAGAAAIVMGVPRPNAVEDVAAWRFTNEALEAAAMDAGAAYISTLLVADDGYLGGLGVPAEALCSANTLTGGNNHPGIYEINRYGQAAVAQLGIS